MARKGENIFKRKDGRWEARYIHHYENGVAKYRYLYAPTYAEVKAKRLHELFTLSQTKSVPFKQSTKFFELAEKWLSHIQSTVKESTYTRYVRIVRSYLCPHIKNMLVCKMDIPYIQHLTVSLSKKGGVKGDRAENRNRYPMSFESYLPLRTRKRLSLYQSITNSHT